MENMEGEIFVVDNQSADGSKEFFAGKFPQVTFIWNTGNEGFAKANNKALAQATGDYILFLNPDTILPEDCFIKCVAFIESKDNSIALGIKMIDGSGKFLRESKRSFPSPVTSLFKLSGLTGLFPQSKFFSKYHLGHLDKNMNHEVDVLAGAFMFIPKKMLDIVGGFDESFFMYGEDIDLSYRIQERGFKNYYFSESCIIHFKGESTKKGSLNYVKLFYKAMSVFVKKHYGENKAGIFNFFIQLAIFFRGLLAAIGGFLKKVIQWFSFKFSMIAGFNKYNKASNIFIAGTEKEFKAVTNFLKETKMQPGTIERIEPAELTEKMFSSTLKKFSNHHATEEIIFCNKEIPYKQVITLLPLLPKHIKARFFSAVGNTLIGK